MSNSCKYLAHFSDVNLGATRDGVLSCHLSSDLTDSLYKSVLDQYPLEISTAEKKHHSSALIEYAAYANSVGKSDFFYWLTPCPRSPETSPLDEVDGGIFTNDDPVDCFVCGDNLTGLDHFQGVCNDCHDYAVLHNLV
ncbi:hypothetical protein [Psychrobacter celer]|uniref:hypothetical protein n=1 Tax=Psychrobacter celer TaxID=306572 RepID=UPI003FD2DA0B